jgi:uncharacterized membrane protein YdbT with pleckstrin-like domain
MGNRLEPLVGEEVLLILRKSLWSQLKTWSRVSLIMILSSVLLYLGSNEYLFIASIVGYISLILYVLIAFVRWYYDVYIVTNMRIYINNYRGVLHQERSEIDLREVLDVKSIRKGILPAIFKYGTVSIEGSAGKYTELTGVSDPDYVSQTIHRLVSASNRS